LRTTLRYRVPGLAPRDVKAASSWPRMASLFVGWLHTVTNHLFPNARRTVSNIPRQLGMHVWGNAVPRLAPRRPTWELQPVGVPLFLAGSLVSHHCLWHMLELQHYSVGRVSPSPGTEVGRPSQSTDSMALRRCRQTASALPPTCPNFGVPPPPEPANSTGCFQLPRLLSAGFPLTKHRAPS
jgi:hypothetical protein